MSYYLTIFMTATISNIFVFFVVCSNKENKKRLVGLTPLTLLTVSLFKFN